jgi:glycosyltransferase involved in cell wall biosynthesis
MHVCIVYDCLFPWTIGGAERWYRNLAERLAAEGHQVTYLTLTQWDSSDSPTLPNVDVVSVGPRLDLYVGERRKIGPPLRFGLGVGLHLLRHGRRYDVVHTASFPYFSLLAAAAVRPLGRFRINCDWHEVWSRRYWVGYLGAIGGRVGWTVQRVCTRVPQRAYTFSNLYARRLNEIGLRRQATVLTGEYAGALDAPVSTPPASPPTVVYAGRMIPEKRVILAVEAIAKARDAIPGLRGYLFGAGPDYERVRHRIAELGLDAEIQAPGFVGEETVDEAMRSALCVVQPSAREGYGMVVVEASARGVPAIVVDGEDNAAVELVDPGQNGYVAGEASAEQIAASILLCYSEGEALRARTRAWFERNAERLALGTSLRQVTDDYSNAQR